ncbi:radial spoke head 1 homolog [Thalassophryne amazonica]|nr:radial spoke head 1 homolog [Thalassophryne amazonica]
MESSGEFIHANHRYQGNFVSNTPSGPGKYIFDNGCEQHGEFHRQDKAEGESDPTITLKWTPQYFTATQRTPDVEP